MLEKIRMFPTAAYLAVAGFARDLKKDERGLSDVVVGVLMILVAVLAVILLWSLLGKQINSWWQSITTKSGDLKTTTPYAIP